MSMMLSRFSTDTAAPAEPREPSGEPKSNSYIAALRDLRSTYVATRREKVIECLMHDYPSGNERRLTEVQNAIVAIDQAIRDEFDLWHADTAPTERGESPGGYGRRSEGEGDSKLRLCSEPSGQDASRSAPAWPSYEAWRSGQATRPNDGRDSESVSQGPQTDCPHIRALWQIWGCPAKLTDAQVDEMLRARRTG